MGHELPPLSEGDCFLETKEAAKLIGISYHTLATWRKKDHNGPRKENGPPFHPISNNLVVYLKSELIAWVRQYRVETGVKIVPAKPGAPARPWER
jgi:transposase-like protein